MRRSQIPNAISIARMLATPVLVVSAILQLRWLFVFVLICALVSDVADGWIARRLGCVSSSGALLDSVADVLLVLATLIGIGMFHFNVFESDAQIFATCFSLWVIVNLAAVIRFRKLASLHTRAAQVGMAGFHGFVLILFLFGYFPWLLYIVAILVAIAALEQLILIFLLSEWTPDMRLGIIGFVRHQMKARGKL